MHSRWTTVYSRFLSLPYEIYLSIKYLEILAEFCLLQILQRCTQKSIYATNFRPFGEIGANFHAQHSSRSHFASIENKKKSYHRKSMWLKRLEFRQRENSRKCLKVDCNFYRDCYHGGSPFWEENIFFSEYLLFHNCCFSFQSLLLFWYQACLDCPENVKLIVSNPHVCKHIPFTYIL